MNGYYSESELKQLGFNKIGSNVLISKKSSIYFPEMISIGSNVRIDDFAIINGGAGIVMGSNIHISPFCLLSGVGGIELGDFTSIGIRCSLITGSDDFSGNFLVNSTIPIIYKNVKYGKIILEKFAVIATNTTVLPGVTIGEGTVVGAHSLVRKSLKSWGIYIGSPIIKKINTRSKLLIEHAVSFEATIK